MALHNRYPTGGAAGVRLDNYEDPSLGRALDLGKSSGGLVSDFTLWVRDANHQSVTLDGLEVKDLIALRDGINTMLVHHGVERVIPINIPVPGAVIRLTGVRG